MGRGQQRDAVSVVIDDGDLFSGIDGKLWEEKPDNRRVVGSE
jgi:hypothetical protein|tara:strand:- start:262 stop:387 length:126 start_codon:yes stop_codon:yes gene_type:complete